jgi:hypothetical protein
MSALWRVAPRQLSVRAALEALEADAPTWC